jgi:hypothetical protein
MCNHRRSKVKECYEKLDDVVKFLHSESSACITDLQRFVVTAELGIVMIMIDVNVALCMSNRDDLLSTIERIKQRLLMFEHKFNNHIDVVSFNMVLPNLVVSAQAMLEKYNIPDTPLNDVLVDLHDIVTYIGLITKINPNFSLN